MPPNPALRTLLGNVRENPGMAQYHRHSKGSTEPGIDIEDTGA